MQPDLADDVAIHFNDKASLLLDFQVFFEVLFI
jgi:hypothetical protein